MTCCGRREVAGREGWLLHEGEEGCLYAIYNHVGGVSPLWIGRMNYM